MVLQNPIPVSCGFNGLLETPKKFSKQDNCYSLSVDCNSMNNFKLVVFHCKSGQAYQGFYN